MAGNIKNYSVNYKVNVEPGKAITTLQTLTDKLSLAVEPAQNLATSLSNVSRALTTITGNLNLTPKIETTTFEGQLNSMVTAVENAALKMRTAIQNAVGGPNNEAYKKIAQIGANSAKGAIEQLNKDIKALEDANKGLKKQITKYDKFKSGGYKRKPKGLLINSDEDKRQYQESIDRNNALISKHKADGERLNKIEKQNEQEKRNITRQAIKNAKNLGKEYEKGMTNVTPAAIREWGKVFGNKNIKNLTVNIRGKANGPGGALTVIADIQAALEALKKEGSFLITPSINSEAYTQAQSKINALVNKMNKLTGPITTSTDPNAKIVALNEQAAKKQKIIDRYSKIPAKNLTVGQRRALTRAKNEIEKINNALEAEKNAAITSQPASITTPPVVPSKPDKKGGRGGTKGKSKSDVTTTIQAIAEITSTVNKLANPPQLQAVAEITKAVSALKKAPEITVSAKFSSAQINSALKEIKPTPTLTVNVALNTSSANQQLSALNQKGVSAAASKATVPPLIPLNQSQAGSNIIPPFLPGMAPTVDTSKQPKNATADKGNGAKSATKATNAKALPPSGFVGSGKNTLYYGEEQPHASLAPKGYHWERMSGLAPNLTGSQKSGYQEALKAQENAKRYKSNAQKLFDKAKKQSDKLAKQVERGRKMMKGQPWAIASIEEQLKVQQEQLIKSKAALEKRQKAFRSSRTEENLNRVRDYSKQYAKQFKKVANLQSQLSFWQGLPAQLNTLEANSQRAQSRFGSIGSYMGSRMPLWNQQIAYPGLYNNAWGLSPDAPAAPITPVPAQPSKAALERLGRMQNRLHNQLMPFARTKEQLSVLSKHHGYFSRATKALGYDPSAGLTSAERYAVLQRVSDDMRAGGTAIPMAIPKEMERLQKEMNKPAPTTAPRARTAVASAVASRSLYDRFHKWSEPLTGATAFGSRTPMAVDMAKGMGVMFAIGGAMSAIGSSFSEAMEYQNTMRTTKAILENGTDTYSDTGFGRMSEIVRNVGVKTKFSAPEVANAAKFLAMAGQDISSINQSIRPIADLALIGDSDLGETADKMTNIMTTFQLDPSQMRGAANIMATTAMRSNTDLMMLAESAKYGGGVAHLYGRNDKNLFADTMALFGVMGNAGIQASSAGTAIRMMYQNIFNPNKKQKAILSDLEGRGISTKNADGSRRSMAEFLIDLANNVPEEKMPEVIGRLFRITAQPGANATIMSSIGSKDKLAPLIALMKANREAAGTNISELISDEKQNTLSGLWAQVTSTFTEGIVKAMEQREGGFTEMLKGLRDYMARPETVEMLQNLLDLIVSIGKVMGGFIEIWAKLYSMAPGLIKTWVVTQMFFTQLTSLIIPFKQLLTVTSRFSSAITAMTGISLGGSAARAVGGAATAGGATAAGSAAASALMLKDGMSDKRRKQVIRARARRIYGPKTTVGGRTITGTMKKVTGTALKAGFFAAPSITFWKPLWANITHLCTRLLPALAKGLGLLTNPITLLVGALSLAVVSIFKADKKLRGTTAAQVAARKRINDAYGEGAEKAQQRVKDYKEKLKEFNPLSGKQILPRMPQLNPVVQKQKEQLEERKQRYSYLSLDLSKDSSSQGLDDAANKYRSIILNDPIAMLGLGRNADSFLGNIKNDWSDNTVKNGNIVNGGTAHSRAYNGILNAFYQDQNNAQRAGQLKTNMITGALYSEGAHGAEATEATQKIAEAYQKYLQLSDGKDDKTKDKLYKDYIATAQAERLKVANRFRLWGRADGSNLSQEEFFNSPNLGRFSQYQDATLNVIDAVIGGKSGTVTAVMQANYDLTNNHLQLFSERWMQAVNQLMMDVPMPIQLMNTQTKQWETLALNFSRLGNGKIDFSRIRAQILALSNKLTFTLQDFASGISSQYELLAKLGLLKDVDLATLQKQIRNDMTGSKYGRDTYERYFNENILPNKNSEWIRAGFDAQKYADFMLGKKGAPKVLRYDKGGKIYTKTAAQEKEIMYQNTARNAAQSALDSRPDATTDTSTSTPTGTGTTTPSPLSAGAGSNQDYYASNYSPNAAAANVVNFNIENLSKIDHMAVAESTDQQALMASMGEQITQTLQMIFAEAVSRINMPGSANMPSMA